VSVAIIPGAAVGLVRLLHLSGGGVSTSRARSGLV
jgi:hypothetical protein